MAKAQNSPDCATYSDDDYLTGHAFFNYENVTGSFNQDQLRMNATAKQIFINGTINQQYNLAAGFWSTFLLPPSIPIVKGERSVVD